MNLAKSLKNSSNQAALDIINNQSFNPNQTDPKTGQTSLHILVEAERNDLLKIVLDKAPATEELKPNLEAKDFESKVKLIIIADSISYCSPTRS